MNDDTSSISSLDFLKENNCCLFHNKQKFLFKCQECEMILSVELEDDKDLEQVKENQFILECPCGSKSYVLRD